MKKIKLTKNRFAIVDDFDYLYLSKFKWCASLKRNKNIPTAPRTMIGSTTVTMTDFILRDRMGHKTIILFKNKNSLDCRKQNLKIVSSTVSAHNNTKMRHRGGNPSSSKYKGVAYIRNGTSSGRWRARIQKGSERIWLGTFINEKEAAEAYNKKARELYGDLAYQNKI